MTTTTIMVLIGLTILAVGFIILFVMLNDKREVYLSDIKDDEDKKTDALVLKYDSPSPNVPALWTQTTIAVPVTAPPEPKKKTASKTPKKTSSATAKKSPTKKTTPKKSAPKKKTTAKKRSK